MVPEIVCDRCAEHLDGRTDRKSDIMEVGAPPKIKTKK